MILLQNDKGLWVRLNRKVGLTGETVTWQFLNAMLRIYPG